MTAVDFEALKRRLAALGEAPKTDEQAILSERARKLAHVPPAGGGPGTWACVVAFSVPSADGPLTVLISAECARAVVRDAEVVPLPFAPPALAGATFALGEVMPVVDLAALLGRTPSMAPGPLLILSSARGVQPGVALRTTEVFEHGRVDVGSFTRRREDAADFERGVSPGGAIYLDGEVLLTSERLRFDLSDVERSA